MSVFGKKQSIAALRALLGASSVSCLWKIFRVVLWKSPAARYTESGLTVLLFGELSGLYKQSLVCSYQNAVEISNISATLGINKVV